MNKDKQLAIRFTEKTYLRVREIAESKETSVAACIRQLVLEALDKKE